MRGQIEEHLRVVGSLADILPDIESTGQDLVECLRSGHKILVAGNGGSAGDAQHFAAELMGRFVAEGPAYPCLALTTDSSMLTAWSNDYGFDTVFSRQIEGIGSPGDIFVGITTSGNSANILEAFEVCKARDIKSFGLLGKSGGKCGDRADKSVVVPSDITARIQECHILIIHLWCSMVDAQLKAPNA